jgi:GcrA cell cycle regulator
MNSTRHPNSAWTTERETELRRMRAEGQSAGMIARELGVSRNAVCGKIDRLGLTGTKTRLKLPHPPRPEPKIRHVIPFTPPTKPTEVIMDLADEDILPAQRKTLMQLRDCHCRWPIGHPGAAGFFFCGGSIMPGLPYCASHARRAYQPARSRAGAWA